MVKKYSPIWPDMSRTKAAIEAFDASDEHWMADGPLGRAVGDAFGQDTISVNDPETCRQVVRPGKKVPGPGEDMSYARWCVHCWEYQNRPQKEICPKCGSEMRPYHMSATKYVCKDGC